MRTCGFGNSRWKTQTSRQKSVIQGTLVSCDTTKTLLRLNVKFKVNSWQMRMDSNQMSNQWNISKYVIVPTCDRYHAKICYPHMLSWKKVSQPQTRYYCVRRCNNVMPTADTAQIFWNGLFLLVLTLCLR